MVRVVGVVGLRLDLLVQLDFYEVTVAWCEPMSKTVPTLGKTFPWEKVAVVYAR